MSRSITITGWRVGALVSALLAGGGTSALAQEEEIWSAEGEERIPGSAVTPAITTPVLRAPLTRMDARVSTDRNCITTATTLASIPGTTVSFTQGGSQAQEVVVTFTAAWPRPLAGDIPAGSTRAGAFVFLLVDDDRVDVVSDAGGVLVHEGTASSTTNGTHSFTFVTEPLAPGAHTARIFVLDNVLGPPGVPNGTVCVGPRSTVVQHN
jgi:hypothetical protein